MIALFYSFFQKIIFDTVSNIAFGDGSQIDPHAFFCKTYPVSI